MADSSESNYKITENSIAIYAKVAKIHTYSSPPSLFSSTLPLNIEGGEKKKRKRKKDAIKTGRFIFDSAEEGLAEDNTSLL